MTAAPRVRKAKASTPVARYANWKSSRTVATSARTPLALSLASVHSELKPEMAMSEGIQPASASTKASGTPEPAGARGNRLNVSKRASGRTTIAARSVDSASTSTTILIAASSALKRPNHSSEMNPT